MRAVNRSRTFPEMFGPPSRQSRVPPVRGRARGSARADREVLFRVKLSARWPSADAIPLWTIGTSPGPPCRPVASTRSPCVASTWTPAVRRQRAESAGEAGTSPGPLDRQSRARDAERLEDGSTIHVATPVCAPTGIVQPRTLRSPSATIGACRGGPAMSLVGRRLPYARLLQRRVWAPAWWRCSRPVRLDTASHLRSGSVGGAWREAHGRTVDGYAARARPVHVPPGASPVGDDDASRAPSER